MYGCVGDLSFGYIGKVGTEVVRFEILSWEFGVLINERLKCVLVELGGSG
jgi:hypothetical protein